MQEKLEKDFFFKFFKNFVFRRRTRILLFTAAAAASAPLMKNPALPKSARTRTWGAAGTASAASKGGPQRRICL